MASLLFSFVFYWDWMAAWFYISWLDDCITARLLPHAAGWGKFWHTKSHRLINCIVYDKRSSWFEKWSTEQSSIKLSLQKHASKSIFQFSNLYRGGAKWKIETKQTKIYWSCPAPCLHFRSRHNNTQVGSNNGTRKFHCFAVIFIGY